MKSNSTTSIRRYCLLTLLICVYFSTTQAQYISIGNEESHTEIGLNFGPTFFLGDLGGNKGIGTKFIKDINPELTKVMKGGYITFYPSNAIGFRLAAQYTYVAGDDALIKTKGRAELCRKQRNLNFRSSIWEGYGAVEIYPTLLARNKNYGSKEPMIKPYLFFGIGLFHFDPEGSITKNGITKWHKLHPLRTEGQGMEEYPNKKPYSLTQINIPMGCGIKISVSPRINTSLELLYRSTFTDYIDDVSTSYIDPQYFDKYLSSEQADLARQISDKAMGIITPGLNRFEPGSQRGNPKNTDAYFSFLFKVGFKIGDRNENNKGYGNNKWKSAKMHVRCPKF